MATREYATDTDLGEDTYTTGSAHELSLAEHTIVASRTFVSFGMCAAKFNTGISADPDFGTFTNELPMIDVRNAFDYAYGLLALSFVYGSSDSGTDRVTTRNTGT